MPYGFREEDWQVGEEFPYHAVLNPHGYMPKEEEPQPMEPFASLFPYDPDVMPFGFREGQEP